MKRFLIAVLLSGVMITEAVLPAVAAPSKAPLQEVLEEDENGLFGLEEVYEEDDSLFEQEEVYEEDDILEVEEDTADAKPGIHKRRPYGARLSEYTFTYDGTEKRPGVTVYHNNNPGKPITDKRARIAIDNPPWPVNVGKYKINITVEGGFWKVDPPPVYTILPPPVSIKNITDISKTSAKIEINGNTNQTNRYKIRCEGDGTSKDFEIPNSQTTFELTGLKENTKYTVKVCSVKDNDRRDEWPQSWEDKWDSLESEWSSPREFTTSWTDFPLPSYTDEEILSKIAEIKNKDGYREGDFLSRDLANNNFKYTTDVIINDNKQTVNAVGMKAFALDVTDQIFGKLSPIFQHRDTSHVKVGDIVISEGFDVYGVVTKVKDGGQVEVATGCPWEQTISWTKVKDLWSPFLRFTCIWTRRA